MFWLLLFLAGICSAIHDKTLDEIKADLSKIFDDRNGDVAPFVYLSWHDAGTYDEESDTGGPYACQRLTGCGESEDPRNNGLEVPMSLLEPIKEKYKELSYADIWALAAAHAIKYAGGPEIGFNYGRKDCTRCQDGRAGRLPDPDRFKDGKKQVDYMLDLFDRYGFDKTHEALVALCGAHTLGNASPENSGFNGDWTTNTTNFDNEYFQHLWDESKEYVEESTPWGFRQFRHPKTNLIMLPSDMALMEHEDTADEIDEYEGDSSEFNQHFAFYFQKMQEFHWEKAEKLNRIPSVLYHESFKKWTTYEDNWEDKGMDPVESKARGAANTSESMMVVGSGNALNKNQGLFYNLESTTQISSFETWFWFDDTSDKKLRYESGVHIIDNSEKILFDVEFAGGEFRIPQFYNEFRDERIGMMPARSWTKLEVILNWDKKEVDTRVIQSDGSVQTTSGIKFRDKDAKNVKQIRFFHWADGVTAHVDELVIAGSAGEAMENEYPGRIIAGKSLQWWAILLICIGGVLCCIILICAIKCCRKEKEISESTKV